MIDVKPIWQQFVSCAPSSINETYNQLKAFINQGKHVVICLYLGRCRGGSHLVTISTNDVKKAGIFGKKLIIKGVPWQSEPGAPTYIITIGDAFIASVDDGLPHPQSIPYFTIAAADVKVNDPQA